MIEALIGCVFTVLGAMVVYFWQDRHKTQKENRKLKLDLKKEQERCQIDKDNAQNSEIAGLVNLQIANIKQDLYDAHEYHVKKGYMPGFIKESLVTKYNFYHDHGANGVGTKLFNELMALPEYKKNK